MDGAVIEDLQRSSVLYNRFMVVFSGYINVSIIEAPGIVNDAFGKTFV